MKTPQVSLPSHQTLARWQVLPLLLALGAGLLAGRQQPGWFTGGETAIWPLLAALLFTGFLHLDLRDWRRALLDRRFLLTVLGLNFLLLPLVTAALLYWLPADTVIRFAVLLVLLAPCTDWFLAFNLIGRGDRERAAAAIPLLLIGQVIALPLWMSLLLGTGQLGDFEPERFGSVFLGLFVLPLALALTTRWLAARLRGLLRLLDGLRQLPGPLLMAVVFLVAAVEMQAVFDTRMGILLALIAIFLSWALLAAVAAFVTGRLTELPIPARRTLVFNAASRNSFVVLPFALALPVDAGLAAAVIMLQALVELTVLILLTALVPRLIR